MTSFSARGLFSLLWNGEKAIEVIQTAHALGLLARLDAGWCTLGALAADSGAVPGRLYKLMDCLESLGLVERRDGGDAIEETSYRAREPLAAAAEAVVGAESMERDRDRHPWREIKGRLPEVVRGGPGIPPERFTWPPATDEQIAGFEASMAVGAQAIAESFLGLGDVVGGTRRVLDVGGGDGTLAARMVAAHPGLRVDVYNLPAVGPLVEKRRSDRLGFVPGDFLAEELPAGYDAMWFVRVLHDWPASTARMLLGKAHRALQPGAQLVISEEIRSGERLCQQFFWSYFLIGLDSCVSRLRDADFYQRALAELGFRDVQVHPGTFDVITAIR